MSSSRYDETEKRTYLIQEVVCNFRDAVVTIHGHSIGNGFFIKGHYIICPVNLVLGPGLIPAERILIAVSNVNMSSKSYSYEADIVGIDGASNIAILYINMDKEWNKTIPPLRCGHPILNWGKSRNSCPGDTIIVIGEVSGQDRLGLSKNLMSGVSENGVIVGNIADNRYVSYGGSVPGELLLLSNIIPDGNQSGMPVITTAGYVIGMILNLDTARGMNVALSEYFMRRPTRALIKSFILNDIPDNYSGFIDNNSNYFRFIKSKLGLNCVLVNSNDFYPDTPNKEIVGYKILSNQHDNVFKISDIITHLNNCPLGDRKGQISPSLVMWRVAPGDIVNVTYRTVDDHYQSTHIIPVTTLEYTLDEDYPWYSIPNIDNIQPIII